MRSRSGGTVTYWFSPTGSANERPPGTVRRSSGAEAGIDWSRSSSAGSRLTRRPSTSIPSSRLNHPGRPSSPTCAYQEVSTGITWYG